MGDYSWLISVVIAIVGYIAMAVTVKNKTEQNSKDIEAIRKEHKESVSVIGSKMDDHFKEDDVIHGRIFGKLDKASEELATHKVQLANSPSMEQVRNEFVSKEMFKQLEKNIDSKIDTTEKHLLDKVDTMGKSINETLQRVLSNQSDLSSKLDRVGK